MTISITKEELDGIYEAIDFIASNSDYADDQDYYQNLRSRLRSISEKARSARYRQSKQFKEDVQKHLKQIQSNQKA